MDFRILGPLEVLDDGRPVELGRAKQRALLALLLVHRNRVVSADRLVEDLWDGVHIDEPAKTLQPHISRLRRVLTTASCPGASLLVSRKPGYLLQVSPERIDAHRFETTVSDGRAAMAEGRADNATRTLTSGLALWRGAALAEFSFASFAQPEITRLEELRRAAVEDLTEARLALGEHRELLGDLEALVAHNPLRERLWGHRILALYRCGRQADALRAYQEFRQLLGDEVGIEPGPELKRLEEAILLQRPELDWSAATLPPERAGTAIDQVEPTDAGSRRRPHNLPVHLTTFIGRAAERAQVTARMATSRLLTLTGAGGCGKTRLALEVAHGVDAPHGVWVADLSAVSDPALVDDIVAATLRIREQPGRPLLDTLADELGAGELLLVLDNCEQVLAACAALSDALLKRCPNLKILATSREPLGVPGEMAWRVPSLTLPEPHPEPSYESVCRSEAVQLFVDRARLATGDFALTGDNAVSVALICRRLDGIALAIELAAARVAVLSVEEVAARLHDCFRLLSGGGRTLRPRQQTLEAAVRWSWDLLSAPEQALLARLSTFAGGFTIEAVEAVCSGGEVPWGSEFDLLAQLHRKSLLLRDSVGPTSRYRLLETIRQYGARRLLEAGEGPGVLARHAAWCAGLARQAESELTGPQQATWLARLEVEHDNLRAALEWSATDGDVDAVLALAGSLTLFWRVRGHFNEGRDWLRRALATDPGGPPTLRAKALWGEGFLAGMLGDYQNGIEVVAESLELYRRAGDRQGCGRALLLLGNFQQFVEGPGVALPLLEESIDLARSTADTWCLAHSLALCGWVHMNRGELGRARPLLEECLSVARPEDDHQSVAMGLYVSGWTALLQGDFATARSHLDEGLAVYRELGESYGIAVSLGLLGQLAVAEGEYQGGRARLEQALALARRIGSPGVIAFCLCQLGRLAVGNTDVPAARSLFEEALAVTGAGQVCRPALAGLGDALACLGDLAGSRSVLDEALAKARSVGDPLDVALALHHLGGLARREGDEAGAMSLYQEALRLRATAASAPAVADSFDALAGAAIGAGRLVYGAVVHGAVDRLRADNGYVRMPAERRRHQADVELLHARLGPHEAQAEFGHGGAMALHEAVAYAAGAADAVGPRVGG